MDLVDEALSEPYGPFTVRRDEPETIRHTKAIRIRLRLDFRGRQWSSVYVEMAPVEGGMGKEVERVPATPLDPLRLEGPETVPCVSVRYQVAQKLHACTEVFEEPPENDRFRDIMDILLLEDLLREAGLDRVREACVEIFTGRKKHAWPPVVTVYESWRAPYTALAAENNLEPADIDEAAVEVRRLIAEIDTAR
jgi:Nucleotidyl transferase AbiEii toxin, Type IV TA system